MKRREALKSIALSTGVVLSSGTFIGILRAAEKSINAGWQPVFLNAEESVAVSRIADVIIPASDSPGALDVGVPQFIDLLLKDVFTGADSDKFRKGLQVFLGRFEQGNGSAFHESPEQSQRAFVEQGYGSAAADQEQVLGLIENSEPPEDRNDEYYLWSFLVTQRELTIKAYFTSEKVGEQVLSYDPIPGRYDPCIPVEKVGNVWTF